MPDEPAHADTTPAGPPPAPTFVPGWSGVLASSEPTTSALASWSWYDVVRAAGGGLVGAACAVLLTGIFFPRLDALPDLLPRLLRSMAICLCWGVPLTAGLCLSVGQLRRGRPVWLRQLGRALAVAVVGAWVAAVVGLVPLTAQTSGIRLLFDPLLTWCVLGLTCGLALQRGFPAECRCVPSLLGGGMAGALIGLGMLLFMAPMSAVVGSALQPVALQVLTLLLAGVLLGTLSAVMRELAKSAWLLVVFGDQPGRHYPLDDLPLTIGSAPDNVLVLDTSSHVLPHHALIRREAGRTLLIPCEPRALVVLRHRAAEVSDLFDGDELQIGETVLRYYATQ